MHLVNEELIIHEYSITAESKSVEEMLVSVKFELLMLLDDMFERLRIAFIAVELVMLVSYKKDSFNVEETTLDRCNTAVVDASMNEELEIDEL